MLPSSPYNVITDLNWQYIDEPLILRSGCPCNPICNECLDAMAEQQRRHTYVHYLVRRSNVQTMARSLTTDLAKSGFSTHLLWYEVTFTYTDKENPNAAIRSIEALKNYSKYQMIDGRFEIGKKGGYHMHFLVKTKMYLKIRDLKKCNEQRVTHFSLLKNKDGHRWTNYIKKDEKLSRPIGWDLNFNL